MDVQKHIRELLMQQDCVIVPGLGGFITLYRPAEEDMPGKRILPPSMSVSFNRQLNRNDGVLISHIAAKTGLAYSVAEEKTEQYVEACKRQLASRGIIILPDIGKLYTDSQGNLNFSPAGGRNYLADAFGLQPVSWYKTYSKTAPVAALPEEKVAIDAVKEITAITKKRRSRTGVAASFAIAAVLVLFIAQGIYIKPLQLTGLSLFSIDMTGPGIPPSDIVASTPPAAPALKAAVHPAPTLMPETDVVHIHDARLDEGYYLVLGSFDKQERAEKYIQRQQLENDLLVLDSGDDHFRVATYVTNSTSQAFSSLDHFRHNFRPDVWLLYNKY